MTAVVVGAGPAGCTLAMYLARQGWRVQVYEKRPEPGPTTTSRQRSWVLAMYPRGIRPISRVAEVPLLAERAYKGLVIKGAKEGAKPTLLERSGVLMDRTLLATSLLEAARSRYAARVSFTFDAPLTRLHLESKTAEFAVGGAASSAAATAEQQQQQQQQGGKAAAGATATATRAGAGGPLRVSYDLLVGADGSSSAVRSEMTAAFPGEYVTEVLLEGSQAYKAVYGLPPLPEVAAWDPDAGLPEEQRAQGQYFFVMAGGQKGFMSICRDIDGCYCGYIASKEDWLKSLNTLEEYEAAVRLAAPQLPSAWVPLLAQKLQEAPVSRFPTMRSLSRFWAPGGVVLVGDAAHTVTPALGQGLNSALEDCEQLAGELAAVTAPGKELDAALRRFSERRAPNIRALQELELLQGTGLVPLKAILSGQQGPVPAPVLLWRKWLITAYSGVALAGTVVLTAMEARRQKQGAEQQQPQLNATYVRSPPMYELLRGHMPYGDMLNRLYGMAAIGTGLAVMVLYGMGAGAVWAATAVAAKLAVGA